MRGWFIAVVLVFAGGAGAAGEAGVEVKYDRFQNTTTVAMHPDVRAANKGFEPTALGLFKGETSGPTSIASFGFMTVRSRPEYGKCHGVNALVDGVRLGLPEVRYDMTVGDGYVIERVDMRGISRQTLETMVAGKVVEFKICNSEVALKPNQMALLRKFTLAVFPPAPDAGPPDSGARRDAGDGLLVATDEMPPPMDTNPAPPLPAMPKRLKDALVVNDASCLVEGERMAKRVVIRLLVDNRTPEMLTGAIYRVTIKSPLGKTLIDQTMETEIAVAAGSHEHDHMGWVFEDNIFVNGQPYDRMWQPCSYGTAKVTAVPVKAVYESGKVLSK